jgi:hypothetical protein
MEMLTCIIIFTWGGFVGQACRVGILPAQSLPLVIHDFYPVKPYFIVLFWGKIFFCVPFNACAAWPPGHRKKL